MQIERRTIAELRTMLRPRFITRTWNGRLRGLFRRNLNFLSCSGMSAICRVNQLLLLLLSQGNRRSYILKNRETINGSVNFKLPELNYDINMRRATDTHRYESVKARGNKNPDAKETLTKEMVWYYSKTRFSL